MRSSQNRFCDQCGSALSKTALFCPACGKRAELNKSEVVTTKAPRDSSDDGRLAIDSAASFTLGNGVAWSSLIFVAGALIFALGSAAGQPYSFGDFFGIVAGYGFLAALGSLIWSLVAMVPSRKHAARQIAIGSGFWAISSTLILAVIAGFAVTSSLSGNAKAASENNYGTLPLKNLDLDVCFKMQQHLRLIATSPAGDTWESMTNWLAPQLADVREVQARASSHDVNDATRELYKSLLEMSFQIGKQKIEAFSNAAEDKEQKEADLSEVCAPIIEEYEAG